MARSQSLSIQTPGAPAEPAKTATELQQQAASDAAAEDAEQIADLTATDSPEVAALKLKLAATEKRNAELLADAQSKANSGLVFEGENPHGKERLAASATKNMTVAEVVAAIDAGKLREPQVYFTCKDGIYCSRANREKAEA